MKLLEAERYLLIFGIDFEDAELEFLADGKHVFRLGDAAVRNVAHVQQAVYAAEVDECAVRHQAADSAGHCIALL